MPLYECQQCHAVENTAMTDFWMDRADGKPQLCSACHPSTRKWHGKFPKISGAQYRRENPRSPIRYPATPATGPLDDAA